MWPFDKLNRWKTERAHKKVREAENQAVYKDLRTDAIVYNYQTALGYKRKSGDIVTFNFNKGKLQLYKGMLLGTEIPGEFEIVLAGGFRVPHSKVNWDSVITHEQNICTEKVYRSVDELSKI